METGNSNYWKWYKSPNPSDWELSCNECHERKLGKTFLVIYPESFTPGAYGCYCKYCGITVWLAQYPDQIHPFPEKDSDWGPDGWGLLPILAKKVLPEGCAYNPGGLNFKWLKNTSLIEKLNQSCLWCYEPLAASSKTGILVEYPELVKAGKFSGCWCTNCGISVRNSAKTLCHYYPQSSSDWDSEGWSITGVAIGGSTQAQNQPPIIITSFGYKFGIPEISPGELYRFDSRKLVRNPWQDPNLRKLDGRNPAVQDYVKVCKASRQLIAQLSEMSYSRKYCEIVIGCQGGKHRSVALAELVYKRLREIWPNGGRQIFLNHRDLHHHLNEKEING